MIKGVDIEVEAIKETIEDKITDRKMITQEVTPAISHREKRVPTIIPTMTSARLDDGKKVAMRTAEDVKIDMILIRVGMILNRLVGTMKRDVTSLEDEMSDLDDRIKEVMETIIREYLYYLLLNGANGP